jgi:hypothetical protein
MVDVDAQDTLKLPAAADQEPVETIAADGADPAFGERVCFRCAKGVRMISMPSLWKTSSKERLNLLSPSWMRKRAGVARWESDQASCRACWARLESPALRGDGVLTLAATVLAATVLAAITLTALLLDSAFAWLWSDPIAALLIATALVVEATRLCLRHRFG